MPVTQAYVDLIKRYFPESQWGNALEILFAESQGDPQAHNTAGEDSRGLFQINVRAHPDLASLDLYDPEINVREAARLWSSSGWQPWSTAVPLGLLHGIWYTLAQALKKVGLPVPADLPATPQPPPMPPPSGGQSRPVSTYPDWSIAGVTLPGTGNISKSFAQLSDLLTYLTTPQFWLAVSVRTLAAIVGLILLVVGAMKLLQSLGE